MPHCSSRIAGLVLAVHRVDLNETRCYEPSLNRIQVSGSEDGDEISVWGAASMNVQSPELKLRIGGDEMEIVLSSRCDSNAGVGGNDSRGISVVEEMSRC